MLELTSASPTPSKWSLKRMFAVIAPCINDSHLCALQVVLFRIPIESLSKIKERPNMVECFKQLILMGLANYIRRTNIGEAMTEANLEVFNHPHFQPLDDYENPIQPWWKVFLNSLTVSLPITDFCVC